MDFFTGDPYRAKIAKFQETIEDQAQTLQKLQESQEIFDLKTKEFQKREASYHSTIRDLEEQVVKAQERFANEVERRTEFIEAAKVEWKKENDRLEKTKLELKQVVETVVEMDKVARELSGFTAKETEAREKYLIETNKLSRAVRSKEETLKITEDKQKQIEIRQKELDVFKQYVADLYGKLATYVKTAEATLEYVNEELEKKGVPIHFALPPGEIVEINIDNFYEHT